MAKIHREGDVLRGHLMVLAWPLLLGCPPRRHVPTMRWHWHMRIRMVSAVGGILAGHGGMEISGSGRGRGILSPRVLVVHGRLSTCNCGLGLVINVEKMWVGRDWRFGQVQR
jgi:hypothetical protein